MKTAKEKMLASEPYQAMGRELFDERQHAKMELFKFNQLDPTKIKARNQIIKGLFGKTTSPS